jgi:hypothetical protein
MSYQLLAVASSKNFRHYLIDEKNAVEPSTW